MKFYGALKRLTLMVLRDTSSGKLVTFETNQSTTYTADRIIQSPPQNANSVLVSEDATQTLTNKSIAGSQITGNISGNAANVTASSNSTLTTLSALSLPGSQVTGNISGNAGNVSGTVAIGNGGTGQTTANPAFNALSPLTTKGDIVAYSTVNARLPVGTNNQVLTADSTQTLGVKWGTPPGTSPDSQIVLYTGNGRGSTATRIRRFSTTGTNIGSGMTLTQSSTNGDSITINTAGIYCIEYVDRTNSGAAQFFGVSKNASSLTTDIDALSASEILTIIRSGAATSAANQGDGPIACITARLAVNDVIRPHGDGTQDNTSTNFVRFSITQIVVL